VEFVMQAPKGTTTLGRLPKLRFGIKGRLFGAFGAVAGLTVLASSVGLVSYDRLGETLNTITSENVPATNASLRVSKISAAIAATAPALLAATSQEQTAGTLAALGAKQQELQRWIDILAATGGGADAAASLKIYAACFTSSTACRKRREKCA
jgi:phosphoglycerate-specific signal transduction histidine kinase